MAISSQLIGRMGPSPLEEKTLPFSDILDRLSYTYGISEPPGDYLFFFEFPGGNSNRGQIQVNGTEIFDSYTTGSGTNRLTAGWGQVTSVAHSGGSKFLITGSGSARVTDQIYVKWVRLG